MDIFTGDSIRRRWSDPIITGHSFRLRPQHDPSQSKILHGVVLSADHSAADGQRMLSSIQSRVVADQNHAYMATSLFPELSVLELWNNKREDPRRKSLTGSRGGAV